MLMTIMTTPSSNCKRGLKQKIAFIFALTGTPACLYAQSPPNTSTAVYFASQAGAITGAAEACNQSITLMVSRTNEAINALAISPGDDAAALGAFESARQSARGRFLQSQQIPCAKVVADFNNLPLLQADYQTTVINPFLANKPSVNTPTAIAPAPVTAPQALNGTPPNTINPALSNALAQQQVANTQVPPANPIYPALTNPTQNYVASTNQQNALAPQTSVDAEKLKLAQQLTQLAQSLAAGSNSNAPSVPVAGVGQPSSFNPIYNSQLNQQLNGPGANNPIFTGDNNPIFSGGSLGPAANH